MHVARSSKSLSNAIFSVLAAFFSLFGQSPASPVFEAVSIKQTFFPDQAFFEGYSSAGTCTKANLAISGNRISLSKVTLCGLIRLAYDVQEYQVSGKPDWMTKQEQSMYYDIEASANGDGALTADSARAMLRTLLADRFRLRLHDNKTELPVYALIVNKGGAKLTVDPQGICKNRGPGFIVDKGILASCTPRMTMAQLADRLAHETDRPVLDRTGLKGYHAFELRWTPEGAPTQPDSAPSLFAAVQDLGLKLEPEKIVTDVLVIDQADKPVAN
jgi:uncharacterized protein (TIGR03435 family)